MEKGVTEVLDGYSIAWIKNRKIASPVTEKVFKRYESALNELKKKHKHIEWDQIIKPFIDVNETIWKYEAAIRQGLVDDDPIMVYSRAILVREFNQLRTGLGNIVSALMDQSECLNLKKDHASE